MDWLQSLLGQFNITAPPALTGSPAHMATGNKLVTPLLSLVAVATAVPRAASSDSLGLLGHCLLLLLAPSYITCR